MQTQEELLRAIRNGRLRRSAASAYARNELVAQAHANFPNDPVAQHRAVEAATSRGVRVAESVATSPEETQSIMDQALKDAFPNRGFTWIETQVGSFVIARGPDGKLYAIPHAIADGGGVQWGEPEEFSGTLDSADALLDAFDGGSAFSPVEAQAPDVVATGKDGKLYAIGHSVTGGVLNWNEPRDFHGILRK